MAERSAGAGRSFSRRDFLTRTSLLLGGAAALASLTKNLTLSPFKGGSGSRPAGDSIFAPRPGSGVRYLGEKLRRFRLR